MTPQAIGWIVRIVAVGALLGAAAAIASPKGRLPLALRGISKLLRQDRGECAASESEPSVPLARRLAAFLLVLLAVAVAVF